MNNIRTTMGMTPGLKDNQPDMFDRPRMITETGKEWLQFHEENPHVLDQLILLLTPLANRGFQRIGMSLLFETLRYRNMTTTGKEFKLNNNYQAFYTRMIQHEYPNLGARLTARTSEADQEDFSRVTDHACS